MILTEAFARKMKITALAVLLTDSIDGPGKKPESKNLLQQCGVLDRVMGRTCDSYDPNPNDVVLECRGLALEEKEAAQAKLLGHPSCRDQVDWKGVTQCKKAATDADHVQTKPTWERSFDAADPYFLTPEVQMWADYVTQRWSTSYSGDSWSTSDIAYDATGSRRPSSLQGHCSYQEVLFNKWRELFKTDETRGGKEEMETWAHLWNLNRACERKFPKKSRVGSLYKSPFALPPPSAPVFGPMTKPSWWVEKKKPATKAAGMIAPPSPVMALDWRETPRIEHFEERKRSNPREVERYNHSEVELIPVVFPQLQAPPTREEVVDSWSNGGIAGR